MHNNENNKTNINISLIISLAVSVLLLAVFILLGLFSKNMATAEFEQFAASRWKNKDSSSNFAQISVFFNSDAGFDELSVLQMNKSYDQKLMSESIIAEENGRLWLHAYSGSGKASVASDIDIRANVTAVGGEFFYFHNYPLLSGQYIKDDPVNKNQILINAELAWRLYGSMDIAGKDLFVDDFLFSITGVYDDSKEADADTAKVFILYDVYKRMNSQLYISAYEVILPDPVRGFAPSILKPLLTVDEKSYDLIVNSDRYSTDSLFENLKAVIKGGVVQSNVTYPYWEQNALVVYNRLTLMFVIRILCLALSIIIILVILLIYRRRISRYIEDKYFDIQIAIKKKIKDKNSNKESLQENSKELIQ